MIAYRILYFNTILNKFFRLNILCHSRLSHTIYALFSLKITIQPLFFVRIYVDFAMFIEKIFAFVFNFMLIFAFS